eukprot:evm.model.NODE_34513_length_15379_cov_20.060343.4
MAEVTVVQGDDDTLFSVLEIVSVIVVVSWDQAAAGMAPDENKGEPKGAHHGSAFVFVLMVWWM